MATAQKQPTEAIKVKQYVTDPKGRKIAVTIDIAEYERINTILKLIPPSEAWLYENDEALKGVRKGLQDAAHGRVSKLNLEDL